MGGLIWLVQLHSNLLLEIHMPQKVEDILSIFLQLLSLLELVDSGYPSPIAFSSHLEWVENLFAPSNLHFLTTSEGKGFVFFSLLQPPPLSHGWTIYFFAKLFHLWHGWVCQRWKYKFFSFLYEPPNLPSFLSPLGNNLLFLFCLPTPTNSTPSRVDVNFALWLNNVAFGKWYKLTMLALRTVWKENKHHVYPRVMAQEYSPYFVP